MADRFKLDLESRTVVGKKVNRLRREGMMPATVYGKGVGPFNVQVNARTFSDTYRRIGKTTLIDLAIPGQPAQSGFIHSVQRHPVTRAILHADLLVVDLLIDIVVDVPIHITGESPLVARGDAILNQPLTALSVRALPTDLPAHVEVDISGLDSIDKTIHVSDLPALEKGTILTPGDELIISLAQARAAEVEEAAEEPAAAEPELVREKREEDEGAE